MAKKMSVEWEIVKTKRSLWVIPVAIVVFIALSSIVVLMPQVRGIISDRQTLKQKESELAVLENKRSALSALSEATLEEQLLLVEEVLPSTKPLFHMVNIVASQAEANELTLLSYELAPGLLATESAESIVVQEEVKPGDIGSLDLHAFYRGTVDTVLQYMKALEESKPLTMLSEAKIKDSEQLAGGDEGVINPRVSVGQEVLIDSIMSVSYSLPLATIGNLADPLPSLSPEEEELLVELKNLSKYQLEEAPIPPGFNQFREDLFVF